MLHKLALLGLGALLLASGSTADHRSICDLIIPNGYQCEVYSPETPDGFLLGVNRIPPKTKGAPAVVLQHGLLDCSATFINNLPHQSLAYILHDEGYDVWLGNSRGNTYSQDNVKHPRHDRKYWDLVDWDLMAKYDLPTLIDYVRAQTGQEKVAYVGHSQGTTLAFAGFSRDYAQINSKVSIFIALAPVAYARHQKSPILDVLKDTHAGWILEHLGEEQFLPNSPILKILGIGCDIVPLGCDEGMFLVMGPSNPHNINGSRLAYYLNWEPADTSVHNMIHWAQSARNEVFQEFNWGSKHKNKEHYGRDTPPPYVLSNISVPVALFSGGNDWLADPKDVAQLRSDLGGKVVFDDYQASYAHLDFVWGLNAHELIYPNITTLLKTHHHGL